MPPQAVAAHRCAAGRRKGRMALERWIFAICSWGCGALFWGIALYARRRKTPMHFWSGSTVKSSDIRDVAAYNRANARMWFWYGMAYMLCGLLGLWGRMTAAGVVMAVAALPGVFVLIAVYHRIEKKYRAG